jgi:PBP1b-binding outer membrane lipoprotein LpoB
MNEVETMRRFLLTLIAALLLLCGCSNQTTPNHPQSDDVTNTDAYEWSDEKLPLITAKSGLTSDG